MTSLCGYLLSLADWLVVCSFWNDCYLWGNSWVGSSFNILFFDSVFCSWIRIVT